MVIGGLGQRLVLQALLAEQAARPALERLDAPKRAAVLMTILGLVLTGLMLVAGVMIGAHWVRRLAREKPRDNLLGGNSASQFASRKAAGRKLDDSFEDPPADNYTGATLQIDQSSDETKLDRPADHHPNA